MTYEELERLAAEMIELGRKHEINVLVCLEVSSGPWRIQFAGDRFVMHGLAKQAMRIADESIDKNATSSMARTVSTTGAGGRGGASGRGD